VKLDDSYWGTFVGCFWDWNHYSDCFHSVGILPDWIDRLNNLVTIGAILEAVFFNIKAETLSGPEALAMSKLESSCSTLPTVHS